MLEIHGQFLQMQKNQKMRESSQENISKPIDDDMRAADRKPIFYNKEDLKIIKESERKLRLEISYGQTRRYYCWQ